MNEAEVRAEIGSWPGVSRETFDDLDRYVALLRHWNKTINLVSRSSLDEVWKRHVLDSAQLYGLVDQTNGLWLDMGSGGGLPGIVVAIIAKHHAPALEFRFIEADIRKATFLRTTIQSLGLNGGVLSRRIEECPPARADVVSARALAPLPKLLEFVDLHMDAAGAALLPKGENANEEIAQARAIWTFTQDVKVSRTHPNAKILIVRELQRG